MKQPTLQRIEAGLRPNPSVASVATIAACLGVPVEFLAYGEMQREGKVIPYEAQPWYVQLALEEDGSLKPPLKTGVLFRYNSDLDEIVATPIAATRPTATDEKRDAVKHGDRLQSLEDGVEAMRIEYRKGLADINRRLEAAVEAIRQEIQSAPPRHAPRRKPS